MLSALRQTTLIRGLPQLLPRYARTLATTSKSPQDAETLDEALNIIQGSVDPFAVAPKPQETQTISLDTMHHHIPPADSPMLHLLTNMVMHHGKRAKAQRVVADTLLHVRAMTNAQPMPIVEQAILAASPVVRCRKQKQNGGKGRLLPMALSERQRTRLGIDWIVKAADKALYGKTMAERLAREIIGCIKGTSQAIKNKEDMHKEAMLNRGVLSRRG